jgi:hypothetical protein
MVRSVGQSFRRRRRAGRRAAAYHPWRSSSCGSPRKPYTMSIASATLTAAVRFFTPSFV